MTYETSARLELRDRARALTSRYTGKTVQAVLEAAINDEFDGRIGLVSSFGTEAAVLLHIISKIDPYVPVIFLDTLKHFPETLAYRDRLIEHFGLCNTHSVKPRPSSIQADDPDDMLYKREPDLCCHVRKTLPMLASLRGLDCWITGRKRAQAATRTNLALFEAQDRWIKINPLIDWTASDVADYFVSHGLPEHPLRAKGYLSIGCAPCTRAVRPGEDSRAGRWADSGKVECGIHIENEKIVRDSA